MTLHDMYLPQVLCSPNAPPSTALCPPIPLTTITHLDSPPPQVLCSPNAPPSTALELVTELLHSGVKEYTLTLPHRKLVDAHGHGRERGDWKAQPLPLRYPHHTTPPHLTTPPHTTPHHTIITTPSLSPLLTLPCPLLTLPLPFTNLASYPLLTLPLSLSLIFS